MRPLPRSVSLPLLIASLLATATQAPAQIASTVNYGTGCDGLALTGVGLPRLGSTFVLSLSGISNLVPLAFMGFGSTSFPVGIPLDGIGMAGCFSYHSLDLALVSFPVAGPNGVFAVPLPTSPSLAGAQLEAQGLGFTFATAAGLASSNGTGMVLGFNQPIPTITGASTLAPTAGSVITLFGTGFPSDARKVCGPAFMGIASNPAGTQMTVQVLNKPGPVTLMMGVFQNNNVTLFGAGETPFFVPPGVTVPPTARGLTGTINPASIGASPIQLTIQGAANTTQLPVTIDGQGRICIDFTGTSWVGGEKVEVELHFDITPPPSVGERHCDFFSTRYDSPLAGTAANCAAVAALFCVQNIVTECPGASFQLVGSTMYIVPPVGHTFVNLHPASHVAVTL